MSVIEGTRTLLRLGRRRAKGMALGGRTGSSWTRNLDASPEREEGLRIRVGFRESPLRSE